MSEEIKYIVEQLKDERERFIRIRKNEAHAGNYATAFAADEKRKAIGIAIDIVRNAILKYEQQEPNDTILAIDID